MSRNQFFTSSNPFVSEQNFSKNSTPTVDLVEETMTVRGAANKTLILTSVLIVSALLTGRFALMMGSGVIWGSLILGLILAIVTFRKPTIAHITAPLYAAVEGVVIGGISAMYAYVLGPGVIINAVLLTALCLFSMLIAYRTGLIKPTAKFRSMIVTATGAIMMIYLVNIVMHMFGSGLPYLHEGGMIGIGISLFIVGIATLNLILDFDNIEKGAKAGAPKHMEWVSSMGLLITLVWIYIEILRLVAIFSGRD